MGNSWPCTVGEQQMLTEWLGSERPWLLLLLTLVCFFIYMCTVACFCGCNRVGDLEDLSQGPELRLVLALYF